MDFFHPPASLEDICRTWTAKEFDFMLQNPLRWSAAAVPILARSSPTDILKAFEASSFSADKATRPLIMLDMTASTISFVIRQYLGVVRHGRLALPGGPETQRDFLPAIKVLASTIPPLLQEALPSVGDCVATRNMARSLLFLLRFLSQLVFDHITFAPSNATDVFSAAFDLFLTTHASLLEVVETDPAVFRRNFVDCNHWQILELNDQFDQYFDLFNDFDNVIPTLPSKIALVFIMTHFLFVVSSMNVLHIFQALCDLTVPCTWLVTYLLLVNHLDTILPASVQNDDKRVLKLLRSVPQGLSALLHAAALMALDPTGTPGPVAIACPGDRRQHATSIATSVLHWLNYVTAGGDGGQFFKHDALDGSEVRFFLP